MMRIGSGLLSELGKTLNRYSLWINLFFLLLYSLFFAISVAYGWEAWRTGLNAVYLGIFMFCIYRNIRDETNWFFRLRHKFPKLFPGFDKEYQKYVGNFDYFGMKITDMELHKEETWIRFQRPDKKRGWVEITDGHITDSDPCIMNKEDHTLLSYLAACVDPDRYGREDRGVIIAHGIEQLRAMIDEAVRRIRQ